MGVGRGGLSSIEETDSVLVEEDGTDEIDEVLEARDERFGESNTAPKMKKKQVMNYLVDAISTAMHTCSIISC